MGQSPSSENYTDDPNDSILVQGNADIKNGRVFPRVWTTQVTKKAEKGDLILSVRAPVGDVGKTDYEVVLGRGVAGIKGNEFIFQMLTKNKENGYWRKLSTGSTFESINSNDIKETTISIPTSSEQDKIGVFLLTLDKLVALHLRKLDALQQLKKGFLQKIFPYKQERVPQIRFTSFYENWEQCRLRDVANIGGGGTPSTNNVEFWDGDIDWYSPAEIGEQRFLYESQKKITGLGLQKSSAKILPVGTVLFTSRAGIGKTAILAKEAATNQGFQSIIPKDELLDSYFIFSRTNTLKRYGEITGAGSTFVEVSGKQMEKMPILIPSLAEQIKIGNFFKLLDDTIAFHKKSIENFQRVKNGLLQKLFV